MVCFSIFHLNPSKLANRLSSECPGQATASMQGGFTEALRPCPTLSGKGPHQLLRLKAQSWVGSYWGMHQRLSMLVIPLMMFLILSGKLPL